MSYKASPPNGKMQEEVRFNKPFTVKANMFRSSGGAPKEF